MIRSTTQILERDWLKFPDGETSPCFAFPTFTWPHLYMATVLKGTLESNGLYLDRLEFSDRYGQRTVFYQRPLTGPLSGVDNPEAIAHLSPNFREEAYWAYGLRDRP